MKKTIYHDAILAFGKYKGQAVADIMRTNPGYFAWLEETGNYALDGEVAHCVEVWEQMNPGEAKKTRYAGQHAKKTRLSKEEDESVTGDKTPKAAFTPKAVNENWGCW